MNPDTVDNGTTVPRKYFGRRLAALRETYSQRIASRGGPEVLLRAGPTAKTLVECLNGHGYQISAATYSEIENGLALPRDGAGFMGAVTRCLNLSKSEAEELLRRLAYDILETRVGPTTKEIIDPTHWS